MAKIPAPILSRFGRDRIGRWSQFLAGCASDAVLIGMAQGLVSLITMDLAREWETDPRPLDSLQPDQSASAHTTLGSVPVTVSCDASERSVRLTIDQGHAGAGWRPLVLLASSSGGDVPLITPVDERGQAVFRNLPPAEYFVVLEPFSAHAADAVADAVMVAALNSGTR